MLTRASVEGASDDYEDLGGVRMFQPGSGSGSDPRLPTQGESIVKGTQEPSTAVKEREDDKPPDLSYLQVSFSISVGGGGAHRYRDIILRN